MSSKKTTIALMYDFDKTLCTKDMQEYSFIPKLEIDAKEFWKISNSFAKGNQMDQILAYMWTMIHMSNKKDMPIHREDFVKLGKEIEFFPGVETWFARINEYAKNLNVKIEHYIISSGLQEIISGSKIQKNFVRIFASEFYYNQNNVAVWAKRAVNYTAKTQFLFRINKGILDIGEDVELNCYTPENERYIPFQNMIYIGDGLTDVPCMKLVKSHGGQSIAVFPKKTKKAKTTAARLFNEHRVNFAEVADYSQDSDLEKLVQLIIHQMSLSAQLRQKHQKQQAKFNIE